MSMDKRYKLTRCCFDRTHNMLFHRSLKQQQLQIDLHKNFAMRFRQRLGTSSNNRRLASIHLFEPLSLGIKMQYIICGGIKKYHLIVIVKGD